AYSKAKRVYAEEINALHAEECPGCSWNGTEMVFKYDDITAVTVR
ncbi:hypothetical protein LCGC14_2632730, partial [marine sediment metagenome]